MALPSLKVKLRVKENVNNKHRKVFILICLIINVFDSFKGMQPFSNTSKEVLQDQYISLVQYTTSYFDVSVIQPMDLWPRLHKLKQEDAPELWALIELCLCCSYGNAVCESFISYLRIVKTDWRNRLNEGNLSDLMRIKVTGPPLRDFREKYGELAVDLRNGGKVRRTTQGKRKPYRRRQRRGGEKKTREMEREEFLREWLNDVNGESDDEESENGEDCNRMKRMRWKVMSQSKVFSCKLS